MKVIDTPIKGLKILTPQVFGDDRGYFFESYSKKVFRNLGIDNDFVQDNQSSSIKGVIRGLHYQRPPFAQAKLVRVIQGEVLDVAVDIRPGSPTYGQWHSVLLSEENKKQFFIPAGFAHGFATLSQTAVFSYKCDNYYHKAAEGGLIYNDQVLKIDWQLEEAEVILSAKDAALPSLGEHLAFENFV